MPTADSVIAAVDLTAADRRLSGVPAEERMAWAAEKFGKSLVVSTSFGAQSAVMLHLASRTIPDIPVIFIDTGYLFPETYRFADELASRLRLNLKVYRPALSSAWAEARHGRLWEQGAGGLEAYNQMAKVEPMARALSELGAQAWLAGLRRVQSSTREVLPVVGQQDGRAKILPIVDWTDRDVHRYLTDNALPYHPLWEKGYVSIGDTHTSRPLTADLTPEQTRFFGIKRECGLHEPAKGR
ncbi:MAG TPA: phosphoadenylyl-sulfate reductase [Opitutaceae bacterium]|jgi:phosphoadenosine phosphosulfate reductase